MYDCVFLIFLRINIYQLSYVESWKRKKQIIFIIVRVNTYLGI